MGLIEGFLQAKVVDVIPRTPLGGIGCGCSSIITFILCILFFPATVKQLDQHKLGLAKNTVTGVVDLETVYKPGRYWIGFWKDFIIFPSTLNTIEFSDEAPEEGVKHLMVLRSRDNEGKQIFLDISIQYRLNPKKIGQLYREMTTTYEDVMVSELRDGLSKVFNLFEIDLAWRNYTKAVDLMLAKCVSVLEVRHAECWGLQLWGVRLTNKYNDKLIETQVQKQREQTEQERKDVAQVRAETEAILSKTTAEINIINTGGQAEKLQIERKAKAQAEANLIEAQARSVALVRDIVTVNNLTMNESQLVQYQKELLLIQHTDTNFIYHTGDIMTAMNAQASKNLIGQSQEL